MSISNGTAVLSTIVTGVGLSKLTVAALATTGDSTTDRDSYQMPLGGNARVTGQSEFSNWGFFVLVYDQDKRLVKSSDEPFTANFGLGEHTIVISHCDENNLCYQGTRNYSVSFN